MLNKDAVTSYNIARGEDMLPLYPAIKEYATHMLKVDDLHTIYIEESGEPDGIPILFLHGGPGSGSQPHHRCYFDPKLYRIILFDQRGCGKSTPHICLENNTTQDLLEDIEKIRQYLGIKKWILFGGSWGATLALLYAEKHPELLQGLIVRGTFLGRQKELDWLFKPDGASKFFPEYWEKFIEPIPEDRRHDLLPAYYDLIHGADELKHMAVAKTWGMWEADISTLDYNPDNEKMFTDPHFAICLAAIETHYFINNIFIEENQILRDAHKLKGIPGIIVHGRYDMVCPLTNSYELAAVWPDAKLEIVRHAGHMAREPALTSALIQATNEFAY